MIKRPLKVVLAGPRGFCAGVDRAHDGQYGQQHQEKEVAERSVSKADVLALVGAASEVEERRPSKDARRAR